MSDTSNRVISMPGFMFSRGRGRGMSNFQLTQEEYDRVKPVLQRLDTSADAIRYLYDQGWSNAAICKVVLYPSDTQYHKAGDPLLPQHVATTISKYRSEKDADPMVKPIRNAMLPASLLVQLQQNEGVEVDVNPKRETLEEIEAHVETPEEEAARLREEAELEAELQQEEGEDEGEDEEAGSEVEEVGTKETGGDQEGKEAEGETNYKRAS